MTIDEFRERFHEIRQRGFIRSHRSGPTGIGHTLEQLLGLTENNFIEPDLGKMELKTHREGSENLITLFTYDRCVWVIPPLRAIAKYGTLDDDGRRGMYFTMSRRPNNTGLFLNISAQEVWVEHNSGEIVARWNIEGDVLDVPGKPVVMHTPGHTPGEVSFFLPDRNVLLCGDTLVTRDVMSGEMGAPQIMHPILTNDYSLAQRSLEPLRKLGEVTLLTGHGDPWQGNMLDAVTGALESCVPR